MDRYVPLPPLPGRLSRLNELAYDLWWSWNAQAREVFRDLDYPLWRFTDHNPVLLLHLVEPERLEHAASDPDFLRLYDEAVAALDIVRAGAGTWWSRRPDTKPIVWVTPQFALHQSLPVDASPLGVLSGDVCKEASDLGVPLIGVGLMYARGYAHQRLSSEGWQQEHYEYIDWSDTPIGPALTPDGSQCEFAIDLNGSPLHVAVWQVRSGRVTVYLLDTDLTRNPAWDRELSSRVFHDDAEARLRQGMLLAIGSVRALEKLGIEPSAWHLAGGPSALVTLERTNQLVSQGMAFSDAVEQVGQSSVFCTRDGAPPRNDGFNFTTVERHFAASWPALDRHREAVLSMGALERDRGPEFNVSVLGSGCAAATELTDSVHLSTWVAAEMSRLFDEHLGGDWRAHQDDERFWRKFASVPDRELWHVRTRLREYLVNFIRERARRRWAREQASGSRLVGLGTLLDPATLTIGFGHRFTEDARPALIFDDVDRLVRIMTAARRPVQLVFAGRAHPGDDSGKHLLQRVFRHAVDPAFGGRIAFLEDYDLHVARLLVQGCDLWLSTPRTGARSSLGHVKAAVNGVPHLGTADAWGTHAHTASRGWLIAGGPGRDAAEDSADARALYRVLEDEIVPDFYSRERDGLPVRWIARARQTLAETMAAASARRLVKSAVSGRDTTPARLET